VILWLKASLRGSTTIAPVSLDRWRTRSEQMRALQITADFFEATNG
jgi:hypothetical protein